MKTKNQGWGIPVPGKVANMRYQTHPKVPQERQDRMTEYLWMGNSDEWRGLRWHWLVALLFLPLVALVFYLIFLLWGRKVWRAGQNDYEEALEPNEECLRYSPAPPTPWPGSYRREWQPHSPMKSSVSHRGMGRFWSCQVHLPRVKQSSGCITIGSLALHSEKLLLLT